MNLEELLQNPVAKKYYDACGDYDNFKEIITESLSGYTVFPYSVYNLPEDEREENKKFWKENYPIERVQKEWYDSDRTGAVIKIGDKYYEAHWYYTSAYGNEDEFYCDPVGMLTEVVPVQKTVTVYE